MEELYKWLCEMDEIGKQPNFYDIKIKTINLLNQTSENKRVLNVGDVVILDGNLEVEVITPESKVLIKDSRDNKVIWVDRNRIKIK